MYYLKCLYSTYMEFVGYDTCDKFIWKSGEGNRIKDKTSKHGSPKTQNKKVSTS